MSALDRAIAAHRARLRSIDRSALGTLEQAYQQMLERLNPLIELTIQQAQADGVVTASELFRVERYQELQRQTAAELERLARLTGNVTTQAQAQAVQVALQDASTMATATARGVTAQATVAVNWTHLPTAAVEDLVGVLNNGPVADLLRTFGDDGMRFITEQIVQGFGMGESPRLVADRIERGMAISRNRALTISRTEMLRASRSASLRVYGENDDVLAGWVWTAAHSDNTCLSCLALDGEEFPLSVQFFESHPNCRCAPRPLLRDIPQREVTTGEQWLNSQPLETQQAMIPNALWADYQAGRIALQDFIQVDQSPTWGRTFREATIGEARTNAERRGRMAA